MPALATRLHGHLTKRENGCFWSNTFIQTISNLVPPNWLDPNISCSSYSSSLKLSINSFSIRLCARSSRSEWDIVLCADCGVIEYGNTQLPPLSCRSGFAAFTFRAKFAALNLLSIRSVIWKSESWTDWDRYFLTNALTLRLRDIGFLRIDDSHFVTTDMMDIFIRWHVDKSHTVENAKTQRCKVVCPLIQQDDARTFSLCLLHCRYPCTLRIALFPYFCVRIWSDFWFIAPFRCNEQSGEIFAGKDAHTDWMSEKAMAFGITLVWTSDISNIVIAAPFHDAIWNHRVSHDIHCCNFLRTLRLWEYDNSFNDDQCAVFRS